MLSAFLLTLFPLGKRQNPKLMGYYSEDDRPPVFKSWTQVYAFLLIFQVLLLLAFHIFMRAFA